MQLNQTMKYFTILYVLICLSCGSDRTTTIESHDLDTALQELNAYADSKSLKLLQGIHDRISSNKNWADEINFIPVNVKLFEPLIDFDDLKAGNIEVRISIFLIGSYDYSSNSNNNWRLTVNDKHYNLSSINDLVIENNYDGFSLLQLVFNINEVENINISSNLNLFYNDKKNGWAIIGEGEKPSQSFFESYFQIRNKWIKADKKICEVYFGIRQDLNVVLLSN